MPEPPDPRLEAARAHLSRQGYLRAALPPAPRSRWRTLIHVAARTALLAGAMAWGTTAAAGAALRLVPVLAAGYLPAVAVAVALGALAGVPLGRLLLRLGATPPAAASALATAGGLGALALLAAAVWGGARTAPPAALWPWLAGTALAWEATRAAVRALERRLSYAGGPLPGRGGRLATGVVIATALALALPLLARSPGPTAGETAASFPRPRGRIAVLAVDGLAREDLIALAADEPDWKVVAAWGWAPLAVGDARLPAVLWTTVATGVPPTEHGVLVLDEVRLLGAGAGVPLAGPARAAVLAAWGPFGLARVVARPASERRVPTFWEMASRAGCPVTVGGWWGSWPVRRVLGEVVSERAWLGGGSGADAATPGLADAVRQAWGEAGEASAATDLLAATLARRAAASPGPHLCALSLPGLDLLHRRRAAPPVALAAASRAHLAAVAGVVTLLRQGGYTVWLVAVPWGPGTAFVASSAATPGAHAGAITESLAPTWLVELGLAPPADAGTPRADLAGLAGTPPPAVRYGPPPPPLAAPPLEALEVQREVLRNLGYLQ